MCLSQDIGPLSSHPHISKHLTVCFINIHHQSGLDEAKQMMIENFISTYNIDIANFSEINVRDDTFYTCHYLKTSYTLIRNNASNGYGTASLVKNNLIVSDIQKDNNGRALVFNVNNILTIWNVYLASGSGRIAKNSREEYCGVVLPQLLLNRK